MVPACMHAGMPAHFVACSPAYHGYNQSMCCLPACPCSTRGRTHFLARRPACCKAWTGWATCSASLLTVHDHPPSSTPSSSAASPSSTSSPRASPSKRCAHSLTHSFTPLGHCVLRACLHHDAMPITKVFPLQRSPAALWKNLTFNGILIVPVLSAPHLLYMI